MINLARLNNVTVAADKKTAIIGGGARVKGTIDAADAAGVRVLTGNCNGPGTLGILLAGGFGNLQGQVGFGVDNILEMRVVTADGKLRTISASHDEDLFWAMRGAGPNFGIVVSATVKAYAMSEEERLAWCGALIYGEDKLEKVIEAVQNVELTSRMVMFCYYASSGPPYHAPVVIVTMWLHQGDAETGKVAFKSLYDIGPMMEQTGMAPYPEWNTGGNPFQAQGERKPTFGVGLDKLDPQTWREVWDKYTEFQKKPTAHASVVLMEAYPMNETRFANQASASFPHRDVRFNVAILPWYSDQNLDDEGVQFGKVVRDLLRNNDGPDKHAT
jgi:hypothetical protein